MLQGWGNRHALKTRSEAEVTSLVAKADNLNEEFGRTNLVPCATVDSLLGAGWTGFPFDRAVRHGADSWRK